MSNVPKIAFIILHYKNYLNTRECLRSLKLVEYPNLEIIVVDNASRDGSTELLREEFPETALVVNETNEGYTGGNNTGLRHAMAGEAEFVFILNNDVIVTADFKLDHLVSFLEDHKNIGIISPEVFGLEAGRNLLDVNETFWWKALSWLYLPEIQKGNAEDGLYAVKLPGCALMIRRSVIERIGYFDESFFMYFEEMDYCVRALKAGFSLFLYKGIRVKRRVENKSNEQYAFRAYYTARNKTLFVREMSMAHQAVLLPLHVATEMKKAAFYSFKGRNSVSIGLLRGLLDGLIGVKGRTI